MPLEERDESGAIRSILERLGESAVRVRFEDGRVDITLAAHRRRVSELARHFGHRLGDVSLCLASGGGGPNTQRLRGEQRTGPSAEILAGELLSRGFLQVA